MSDYVDLHVFGVIMHNPYGDFYLYFLGRIQQLTVSSARASDLKHLKQKTTKYFQLDICVN